MRRIGLESAAANPSSKLTFSLASFGSNTNTAISAFARLRRRTSSHDSPGAMSCVVKGAYPCTERQERKVDKSVPTGAEMNHLRVTMFSDLFFLFRDGITSEKGTLLNIITYFYEITSCLPQAGASLAMTIKSLLATTLLRNLPVALRLPRRFAPRNDREVNFSETLKKIS